MQRLHLIPILTNFSLLFQPVLWNKIRFIVPKDKSNDVTYCWKTLISAGKFQENGTFSGPSWPESPAFLVPDQSWFTHSILPTLAYQCLAKTMYPATWPLNISFFVVIIIKSKWLFFKQKLTFSHPPNLEVVCVVVNFLSELGWTRVLSYLIKH